MYAYISSLLLPQPLHQPLGKHLVRTTPRMPSNIPKVGIQSGATPILLRISMDIRLIPARALGRDISEAIILVIIQNLVPLGINVVLQDGSILVLCLPRRRMRGMNGIEAVHHLRVHVRRRRTIERRQVDKEKLLIPEFVHLVHVVEDKGLHCFVEGRECGVFAAQEGKVDDVVYAYPHGD